MTAPEGLERDPLPAGRLEPLGPLALGGLAHSTLITQIAETLHDVPSVCA